jgi:hypothetical protein
VSSIDRDAFSAPKAALLGYYDTRLNLDREAVARLVQERYHIDVDASVIPIGVTSHFIGFD